MKAKIVSQDSSKLLDRMRAEIHVRHYSIRTKEVRDFLNHLAVERNVLASTQNLAKAVRRMPVELTP